MSLATMRVEVQRRVTQISSADADAALQRAVRWINRQGSYTFQLSDPTTLAVTAATGVATIPATMDVGKGHLVYNTNGVPIRKVGVQDAGWQSANYGLPAAAGWDSYIITRASLVFFPPGASQPTSVNIVFHLKTVDIVTTANTPRDFDDLIIDFAEAEERRIYDVGDMWPQVLARVQDQIKTMLDGYRSTTLESMPTTEAMAAVAEKLQVGRA